MPWCSGLSRRTGQDIYPYETLEKTTLREAMSRVFGQDVMPDFDIENSNYLLSFGADFLDTWVSPVRYARGYGVFRQGREKRGTFVHVDSRFSMTAANADDWVYVRPGREGLMALSIAQVIVSSEDLKQFVDDAAAQALTGGDPGRLDAFAPEKVAREISEAIPGDRMAEKIREVARDFATHQPSLAIGGGSAAAHTNGLFNLSAIYSLNHLVGNVGKPGGVIFNPAPALGDVPATPESGSFEDWEGLAREMESRRVDVLMVRGADPMYGLPSATRFREASYKVPFIFSFSDYLDDTTAMSDLVLPQHDYLEDWGSEVPDPGPGYQVVGFQQPVVRPFFEARGIHLGTKGFADVLLTLAQMLEMDLGFPGNTFKDILMDGAATLMGRGSVNAKSLPAFWNGVLQRGGWWDTSARYAGATPKPPELPTQVERPKFDGAQGSDSFYLVPFASTSLTDGRGARLPWLQATP